MKIEIEIPDPPKGWEYQKRSPNKNEPARMLNADGKWTNAHSCWADFLTQGIFAYRSTEKRFLEPYDLAGKWIQFNTGGGSFVGSFNERLLWLNGASEGQTVRQCFEKGDTYSDTPTSEKKSLQVDA
jgi:hypothetical protein